jgi:hypothetical protein
MMLQQPRTCCNGGILSLLIVLFCHCTSNVDAFTSVAILRTDNLHLQSFRRHHGQQLRLSSSSSSNPEVEALLAAAAKAREEANRLSEVQFVLHTLYDV